MKHLLASILSALIALPCLACYSDYDCGYGQLCSKPKDSYATTEGICVQPTRNNAPMYNSQQNWQGTTASGCYYDNQCGIGGQCLKTGFNSQGICVH